jgi:hypothetical protein
MIRHFKLVKGQEAAMRGRGVGPGVVERAELGSGLGDAVEDGEQITGRARQPVEPGDEEGVAVAERLEQLGELGPIGARTGDLLAVEAVAASGQ